MHQRQLSILAILLLPFIFCNAQSWQALNPSLNIFNNTIYATAVDTAGNIYSAGDFVNSSNNRFVAKWNGVSWSELGSGNAALNANFNILSLAYGRDGSVYAAGGFTNASGYSYVAKWNGSTWSELRSPASALNANASIYSVIVDKSGNVFAAGRFENSYGYSYVAKWDGNTWSELKSASSSLNANGDIFSIAADAAGNVYAGGYFTNTAGKQYVAKWNGVTWSETGSATWAPNLNGYIRSLATDTNGNVYAAGDLINTTTYKYYIAKWNGSTWSELGNGQSGFNSTVASIVVSGKNELYASGYFTYSGEEYVAKWNGTEWFAVDNPEYTLTANGAITSIQVDANDHIIAGGKFTNKSGHNYIATWNGSVWSEPGDLGDPFYASQPLQKIVSDANGKVYVLGSFSGTGQNRYIEYWNGSTWKELYPEIAGQFAQNAINGLSVGKDGNIYAGGAFTDAGGKYYIAKWDGNKWSKLEDFSNSLYAGGPVTDVATDKNGNVFASGQFNDPELGTCALAKWDGNKWTRLAGSAANYISEICVSDNGNIYAIGAFLNEFGSNYIAKYNGSGWEEVRNGNSRFTTPGQNEILVIATDSNGDLYANGNFTNASGQRYIAHWDGTSWSQLGALSSLGKTLAIDPSNNIYSDGSIDSAFDCAIKKWNGTSWVSVGAPVTIDVMPLGELLAADPNGNLYSIAPTNLPGVSVFITRFGSKTSPSAIQLCPAAANTVLTSSVSGSSWQWQSDTGNGFINISDNNNYTGTNTYSLHINNIPSSWAGYKYQCVVNDSLTTNTYTIKFVNTWKGTISSAWENPANWSCGAIPDSGTDVIINTGNVVLSSNASIKSLNIKPGVNFLVNPGFNLTVIP